MAIIGVDLGGTKIEAAEVSDATVHHRAKVPTPDGEAGELVTAIVELVVGVAGEHDLELDGVGIGAPGTVDPAHGVLRNAPNLATGDADVALAALIGAGLDDAGYSGVEIRVDNDVNVAARGEWRHGAGAGHDNLLAVWWGTGIGGGLVLDGEVRTGGVRLGRRARPHHLHRRRSDLRMRQRRPCGGLRRAGRNGSRGPPSPRGR